MLDTIGRAVKQHAGAFRKVGLKTKLLLVGGILGGTLAIVLLVQAAGAVQYGPLYANLDPEDASATVGQLRRLKIPYEVGGDGRTVRVPIDRVAETRLDLAAAGLPRGGSSGFELFDQQSLATTPFVQKINYQRAMQGELARSIASLDEVEAARVHLVLPSRRLFREDDEQPKASVVVRLAKGRRLARSQIAAIVHLAATAVEGLTPQRISVLDQRGRLLARPEENPDDGLVQQNKAMEITRNIEQDLERRASSVLTPILGPDTVQVRVSASLDFGTSEETEERFDPDSAVVRSEQRVAENHEGSRPEPMGVAGARGNLPKVQDEAEDPAAANTPQMERSRDRGSKERTVVNYEINKTVRHTRSAPYSLDRLSVAVLMNGEAVKTAEEAGLDVEAVRELTKRAVGFNGQRGDEIEVVTAPFAQVAAVEMPPQPFYQTGWFWRLLEYGALVLVALLLFLFLVRPAMRAATRLPTVEVLPKPVAELEAEIGAEAAAAEGESAGMGEGEAAPPSSRDRVLAFVDANAVGTADVLRSWMTEQASE